MISLTRWKYLGIAASVILLLHLLLSIHPTYRQSTDILSFGLLPKTDPWRPTSPPDSARPVLDQDILHEFEKSLEERRRAKAAFVILARNSDLWQILDSMRQMEDRFNHWARYDYVFLNDDDFTEEFKRYTQALTKAKCHYGKVDAEDWNQPSWIDEEKAAAARQKLVEAKVIYGDSVPYRNMCRFYSGYFYRHPLMADYDYYWRIDPGVKFYCDITYDPFLLMQDEKKVYGFTISLFEYIGTIPTLWDAVKEFVANHPDYLADGNAMSFVSDDGGESYNKCHFWSNFEIADLNFWRSPAYTEFFDFLDSKGGFYYERWGDAPIHSIAAALFAKKEQIHFFSDIGYKHEPFTHCPQGDAHTKGRCWCNERDNFDWEWYSCTKKYVEMF
ncbi:hypothetical protein L202_05338 [Cryptococcus amylolentus CBS 6039]|uniref:Alpha-1,2 mannosyltransferase KTR1 n=2 Tax=Cryptococcus amylolentus TaxID=104669 RepID=A0A1E3HK40_9TREE|nr:hypothetical protein L202_05338 [Cryptococcus amylolentus CBS 6039]ODN76704.1 hypothetical protein L202_05338 [Cryptococcus amylolentus CBS 6039]ODO04659.1 hypothetical protein I350_05268 [Cryptococcus amylolentus CBS 6273]